VTERSKASVCGRSSAETVGSYPRGAWMSVSCRCCVLSCRGLCDDLITRPEESCRLWCVTECGYESSWKRTPWTAGGCCAKPTDNNIIHKVKVFRLEKKTENVVNQPKSHKMWEFLLSKIFAVLFTSLLCTFFVDRFLSFDIQFHITHYNDPAPNYVASSTPLLPRPPMPKYSPQHPILKHPQPAFRPRCQQQSFTPKQNNWPVSGSLSPRYGASSGCGWRNGLHYGGWLRMYWISSRGQPTRGSPPAWGLGEVVTTPHLKNVSCYEMVHPPLFFSIILLPSGLNRFFTRMLISKTMR
jgi:hypothetical protein